MSASRNLWQNEPIIDNVTNLIIRKDFSARTTLLDVLETILTPVKLIAINLTMFVNLGTMNMVITVQNQFWWNEIITRIDPALRNSDPPCANISVVNQSSQQLLSLLILCIKFLKTLPVCVNQ